LLALGAPSQAQMPVIDFSSLGQLYKSVQTAAQQLETMQQQLQQVMNVYNAVSHVTDINSAVSALGMVGVQNPLPVNIGSVQSLLSGRGGVTGMSGSIGSLFNNNSQLNSFYSPTGNGYEATLLQRNVTGTSGIQALAGQLYQTMSDRLPLLKDLQNQLASSPDVKTTADITARIAAEQSYIQAQSVQAQTLAMLAVASQREMDLSSQQKRQQDIDSDMADNPWHGQ
jgi:hypothetical protein